MTCENLFFKKVKTKNIRRKTALKKNLRYVRIKKQKENAMQKIYSSSQDYLEAILELSPDGKSVKSIDVAKKLNVSRASVNRAMNILKEQGYLTQERYGDIYLTEKGIAEGKAVKETHELLEKFLFEILKVSAKTAESDACKIEHCLSDETREKLKNFVASQTEK